MKPITKENLLADNQNIQNQINALQGALNYNNQLIAFMDNGGSVETQDMKKVKSGKRLKKPKLSNEQSKS